jgi:hypothetical protein
MNFRGVIQLQIRNAADSYIRILDTYTSRNNKSSNLSNSSTSTSYFSFIYTSR